MHDYSTCGGDMDEEAYRSDAIMHMLNDFLGLWIYNSAPFSSLIRSRLLGQLLLEDMGAPGIDGWCNPTACPRTAYVPSQMGISIMPRDQMHESDKVSKGEQQLSVFPLTSKKPLKALIWNQ